MKTEERAGQQLVCGGYTSTLQMKEDIQSIQTKFDEVFIDMQIHLLLNHW